MKFCEDCGGRLERIIIDGANMQWLCVICHKPYDMEKEDSLIYEVSYESFTEGITDREIKNAAHDTAAMTVYKKCDKCGEDTMIAVRSKKDEQLHYTCRERS